MTAGTYAVVVATLVRGSLGDIITTEYATRLEADNAALQAADPIRCAGLTVEGPDGRELWTWCPYEGRECRSK